MCDPARASGLCRSCGGQGRVACFNIAAEAWPSALSGSGAAPDGRWPCPACNGSGHCTTCYGVGMLDDEAWDDALVQPYL